MAEEEAGQTAVGHRRMRKRRRRKSRRRQKLMYNLKWLFGGLAVGLPVLAFMLWFASTL